MGENAVQIHAQKLKENIKKVIFGKDEVIDKLIVCLFCSGHILLEDIPGTGKTTMAKALAKSVGCDFKRVQFTPDLLPSDLTGINFFSQKESEFVFKKGALFTNILLGDEINRATPKTQSSLLECMEEGQVSVDGESYTLDAPFLVIATQNPIEIQGTYPLPEAQLDRFFMQISVGYPNAQSEQNMLKSKTNIDVLSSLESVVTKEDIISAQTAVKTIKVADTVLDYIIALVNSTRSDEQVRLGVSPRGSFALMRAAQGKAAISGRDFVTPDDVKSVATDVLAHRIITKGMTFSKNSASARDIVENLLNKIAAPTEELS